MTNHPSDFANLPHSSYLSLLCQADSSLTPSNFISMQGLLAYQNLNSSIKFVKYNLQLMILWHKITLTIQDILP